MRTLFFSILLLFVVKSYGQAPIVQKIDPVASFPNDTITISGNGFNDNPANLEVWFDNVEGEIIESTVYSIKVVVPMEARASNVEVINKLSKLSGKSDQKFTPNYEGSSFSVAKFANPLVFTANEELWDLCNCDFDGDGRPDIATTKFTRTGSVFDFPSDLVLLHNTSTPGTLSFTKKDRFSLSVLNLTFPTDNVICGDIQGDGKPEMIVTRAGSPRHTLHIFKNTSVPGTLSFESPVPFYMDSVTHFATRMALRDLNKDGKPEIIVTNSAKDFFYIFINQSSGGNISFASTSLKISIKTQASEVLKTYETDVQDFNGDGLPDIIINQFQNRDVFILKNQSEGSIEFAAPQKVVMPGNFNRIASADFNKDGLLDVVITNTILDRADVLINQSSPTTFAFSSPIELTTSFEPWGVDLADIDGDNDTDIVIANKNKQNVVDTAKNINVFLNNGASTPSFARKNITFTNFPPTRNLRVNDFDGDGKPDIAYTGFNEITQISQVGVIRNMNCHQARITNEETEFCAGRTVRLQAVPAGNVTFAWEKNGSAIGSDQSFLDIDAPGTYKVTVTGEGGACITTDEITMSQPAGSSPPAPDVTSNGPLCAGKTLNLNTTNVPSATYSWTGPNDFTSTQQNPTIPVVTIDNAGEYNLQITLSGCKSPASSVTVGIGDMTGFQISSPVSGPICQGGSVMLSVNNLPGHTYQWSRDGAPISAAVSASLTATQDGSYTVFIVNEDLADCSTTTQPSVITMLTPPVAKFNADASSCIDEVLSFTNSSEVDDRATAVYSWTFGDTGTSNEISPTHAYTTANTFNAKLIVQYSGVGGCSSDSTRSITVLNPILPTIETSAESACPDGEVVLTLNGTFGQIAWSNSETDNSITVGPGEYSVTTVDANGCGGEDDISITSLEIPVVTIDAGRTTIPAGDTTLLIASGASTYVWTPVETLSDFDIANPIAAPIVTTNYNVVGTAENTCTGEADITITVSGTLGFPPAFSPNGDADNEFWNIRAETTPECTLTIFNGRGSKVFEKKGQNWNGTYEGKVVPSGTYYYVFSCPDEKPVTGSVLVFK